MFLIAFFIFYSFSGLFVVVRGVGVFFCCQRFFKNILEKKNHSKGKKKKKKKKKEKGKTRV